MTLGAENDIRAENDITTEQPGAKNDIGAENDTLGAKNDIGAENDTVGTKKVVVEFVADVVVVVPVVAPSGRGDAVASPRPAVADPRVSRGTTWAAAWRPATERMNTA